MIQTSLKEERQTIFHSWTEGVLNKDWATCDTCPILLLHTLSDGSEHRLNLSKWHEQVLATYKEEAKLLEEMLQVQQNPFQKEQLKLKKFELDEWKALELHDKFFDVFSQESLIEKD